MISTFCMLNLGCFGHERKKKRKKGNWRFRRLEWATSHFDFSVVTDFPAHFEPSAVTGFSVSRRGGAIARTNARDKNVAACTTVVRVRTRQGFSRRPSESSMADGGLSRQTAHSPSIAIENFSIAIGVVQPCVVIDILCHDRARGWCCDNVSCRDPPARSAHATGAQVSATGAQVLARLVPRVQPSAHW